MTNVKLYHRRMFVRGCAVCSRMKYLFYLFAASLFYIACLLL